jgi:mycofactocin glycosyltransferase
MPRFRLDDSVQRFGTTVLGGSPITLFRLTDRGAAILDRVAAGEDVPGSRLVDAMVDAGALHPVPADHSSSFATSDVTIVVPTLGPLAHVPANAVVVDDGSVPPVPGAAIRLDQNRGPAAARNAGLGVVRTPLVAFVDADVAVPPDWLERLLPHFDDERVAIVAPRVRSRSVDGLLGRWEREHSPLDLGPTPARVRAGTRVSYVPAAAIVCRTEALQSDRGLDETLRFGEDVDLVWRLDAAGWRCRYEPGVVVEHDPRPSWRAWVRQRIGYGSSAAPLSRRHPGSLAPVRASGWSISAWAAGVLGHPVLGGLIGIGTGVALARKLPDLPAATAVRLATNGTVRAGAQSAIAIRRVWWPLLAVAGLRSRRARSVLGVALIAAGHPLRVADDLAYSAGVWLGMARERTLAPLVPDLTSWPGRRASTPVGAEPLPSSG